MRTSSKCKWSLLLLLFIGTACKEKSVSIGETLYPFTENDLVGYLNSKGEKKIAPQFDEAGGFSQGRAVVRLGKGVGYIDRNGKYTISPIYEGGGDFSEGLAPVKKSGLYGYINLSGKVVIDFQFQHADRFSEGFAAVSFGGRFGFVDSSGQLVINPIYRQVGRFSNGLAPVRLTQKVGYIDQSGNLRIKAKFDSAGAFEDGLAAVSEKELAGFIDSKGKYIIEAKFLSASAFSDGLAAVQNDKKLFSYIDKTGKEIIGPTYESAGPFKGGLALVRKGLSLGYIDKKGEPLWQTKLPFPLAQVRQTFPLNNELAACINVQPSKLIEREGGHDFTISSLILKTFAECKCPARKILLEIKDSKAAVVVSTKVNVIGSLNQIAKTGVRFDKEQALSKFTPPFAMVVRCEK